MKRIVTLLLVFFIGQQVVVGQCDPPAALTCSATPLLCALDMLDGFSCTTLSTNNPTGPNPLCGGVGTPSNTQWWAFKGNGKGMTITFNVDLPSCSMNKGISAGILYECGGNSTSCNSNCNTNSFSLSFSSYRCQTYFLWVDGCEGDICDFDIQITNGEPHHLPSPLASLEAYGEIREGCRIEVWQPDMEGVCWYANYTWTLNGTIVGHRELNEYFTLPLDMPEVEICLDVSVGKGSMICDEATNCITLFPDPIQQIDEGEMVVCWENHEGLGIDWHNELITTSCIDPPCKTVVPKPRGCPIEYIMSINLLPAREIKEIYQFVCEKSELPYITEDGQNWNEELCGEEIKWSDRDFYNCDTAYNLNLEIFNPVVEISKSCPDCKGSTTLSIDIEYEPECSSGITTWIPYWTNEFGDTLGVGDILSPRNEGTYSFDLQVTHTPFGTTMSKTCSISDTSWHIKIKNEPLTISGDTSICQVDTSEFSLPESYSHGCKIDWTLEDVTGNIIISTPDKMSTIKVHWPTHNTVNGKICAEIIDNCDSVRKVCFDLEGCVTTNSQNIDNQQWTVFPNPARDIIYIQGENIDKTTISMHDLEGNSIVVQPKQDISGAISIDISEMASGIYLIQLKYGEKKEVIRFVKL